MKCLECQEMLQRRLDGERLPAAAVFEQHLSECATCREQHAAALRLLEGLKQLPSPSLAPNFAQTMAAAVMHDRRQRQQKTRRRVFVTMALAASVLLMLAAAYYWPRSGESKTPIANQAFAPQKDPLKEVEKKPEPPNTLTALPDRWAATTRDHAKVVLAAANLDDVEKLNELPGIDPGVREAGQEVTDGVRAVTINTRRAFDFFARELPMPDMSEQKN